MWEIEENGESGKEEKTRKEVNQMAKKMAGN
jgi:hypothetical protein